jgi:hypothetical protein
MLLKVVKTGKELLVLGEDNANQEEVEKSKNQ